MVASSRLVPDFTGTVIGGGRYKCVERIAAGAFGVVYRAVGTQTTGSTNTPPLQYAVKILPKWNPESPSDEQLFHALHQREIHIHAMVSSHDNIVTLHEAFENSEFRFMVLEFCEGPDLFRFLCPRPLWRDDAKVKNMFLQILDAVGHMHSMGVSHRDLKPENILCSSNGDKFYVTDFGLSTESKRSSTKGWGTMNYMSPECMSKDRGSATYCTSSADVWSLGIILVNILFSEQPWDIASREDPNFYDYTTEVNYYLRYRFPLSKSAHNLLRRMLHITPSARMSIEDIKKTVAGINTFFMTDEELLGEYGTTQNRRVARLCRAERAIHVVVPRALPQPKRKSIGPVPVLEIDLGSVQMPSFDTNDSLQATEESRIQMMELGLFAAAGGWEGDQHKYSATSDLEGPVPRTPLRQLVVINNTSETDSDGPITPETHPMDPNVYGDSVLHLPNPYDDLELRELDIGEARLPKGDVFDVNRILDTPPKRKLPTRCLILESPPREPQEPEKKKWFVRNFRELARKKLLRTDRTAGMDLL